MALLFDNDDPDASQGFKNLKAAPAGGPAGASLAAVSLQLGSGSWSFCFAIVAPHQTACHRYNWLMTMTVTFHKR